MFVVLVKNESTNMTSHILISKRMDGLSEHEIVSREQWLVARKDLLTREKELTRLRDDISRQRRELPWVKIDKEYVFDAPEGGDAGRVIRRSQSAFHQALHDGTGPDHAMRRLLTRSRSH